MNSSFDKRWCQSLANVLTAFLQRNPSIGYCQGLNFVVGTILKQLNNEEDAFWLLTMLCETNLPLDYYCSIIGVLTDFKVFSAFVEEFHLDLLNHFKSLNVELSLFAFQWFICLFSISLSKVAILRAWDILCLKGSKTLFQIGLVILDLISKKCFKCTEYNQLFNAIDIETKSLTAQAILQKLGDSKYKIKNKQLKIMRSIAYSKVKKELNSNAQTQVDARQNFIDCLYLINATGKEHYSMIRHIQCDPKWPICVFDITYKKRFLSQYAIRTQKLLDQYIIDDYFYLEHKKKAIEISCNIIQRSNSTIGVLQPNDLMIERNPHYCDNSICEKIVSSLASSFSTQVANDIYDHPEFKEVYFDENSAHNTNSLLAANVKNAIKRIPKVKPSRSKSNTI